MEMFNIFSSSLRKLKQIIINTDDDDHDIDENYTKHTYIYSEKNLHQYLFLHLIEKISF
jgi:hypothetical protein